MEKWSTLLKSIAAVTCLACFFANNFVIFKQFASHKTVTGSHYKLDKELLLPVIIICNGSGFKNPKVSTVDLDDYLNNTFELSDVLISIISGEGVGVMSPSDDEHLYNSTYKDNLIHIDSFLTYYRGRCYSVEYKKPVI